MEQLEEFDFSAGRGRTLGSSKYPLDDLLNGGIWRLTQDDFPNVKLRSLEGAIRSGAKMRKLKLRTRYIGNGTVLVLQAYSGKKKK